MPWLEMPGISGKGGNILKWMEWLKMAENVWNGRKWLEMAGNNWSSWKWLDMAVKGYKLPEIAGH